MKRFLRLFVVTLIALLGLSGGMLCEFFAEHQTKVYASTPITLNGVFGDNMILQRNKQVKIWGYGGTVGEEVKVSFNGQTKTAVITSEGWEVYLDPMEGTFEEQSIVVTSGTQSLVVNNVCVGEVVFTSGQSNIAITVSNVITKRPEAVSEYSTYKNFSKVRFYTPTWGGKEQETIYTSPYSRWVKVSSVQELYPISAYAAGLALNLQAMLGDVPVGVVEASTGGSFIEQWISTENMKDLPSHAVQHAYTTSVYYNGMVHFLKGFAIGGVFWYQGEACIGFTSEYEKLLPALINQYRNDFEDENLPVYIMQLPQLNVKVAYGSIYQEPGWIKMRSSQEKVAESMDNVYCVCLIDTGDASTHYDCIHPADKWIVTRRSAGAYVAESLNIPYEDLAVQSDYGLSPKVKSAIYKNGKLTLNVENATSLTIDSAVVKGFKVKYADDTVADIDFEIEGTTLKAECPDPVVSISYLQVVSTKESLVFNEYGLPIMPIEEMNVVVEKTTYTVRYMDGDTLLKEMSIPYGESPDRYIPEKEDGLFLGWYLDEELTQFFSSSTTIRSDMVLYAKFKPVKTPVTSDVSPKDGCNSSVSGSGACLLSGLSVLLLRKNKK